MVSAVYRAPVIEAQTDSLSASVRSQAAAGHFRAIALWLNEPLAPHGIYVQVQADSQPGCLRLLLEFEQPPLQDRLVRFLCHRIWLLNSPLIEGISVTARPANRRRIFWQQRIRIITPALKERRQSVAATVAPSGSPLPPRLKPGKSAAPMAKHLALNLVGHHLKTFRALILTGSAVAAFVFGCLMEVILSGSSPMLPTFTSRHLDAQEQAAAPVDSSTLDWDADATGLPEATPVSTAGQRGDASASPRSPIVDAALEPVVVIQHDSPPPRPQPVTLLFGGDIAIGKDSYNEAGQAKPLFSGLKDYQQADLSMVNLSTPLATAATSLEEELYHRTRPEAINLLKAGGVDLINLSSESNMEFGGEGLTETLETLDREGLYRVGAGRNEQEARRPEVIDVKGQRIAYLSYAQGGDEAAHGDRPGVNAQGQLQLAEDIRALRDQVDWIVVNYRWQTDIPAAPADWQKNIARMAVEQGADLVVGYHPDTLQGAEVYKGRPIVYSLGDFIFQDPSTQAPDAPVKDQDTAVLKVSLRDKQMKVEFVPVRVRNAQVDVATGRDKKKILRQLEDSSASLESPMRAPVVLKLKGSGQASPVQPVSPGSSFVAPAPTHTQSVAPIDPNQKLEETPSDLVSEPESTVQEPSSAHNLLLESTSEPESTPQESLSGQDTLQDWGPKGTPSEQFTPIPDTVPQSTLEDSGALPRSTVYEPASNGSFGEQTGSGSSATGLSDPAATGELPRPAAYEPLKYGSSATEGLSSPAGAYESSGDGSSQTEYRGDGPVQNDPYQDEAYPADLDQDQSYQEDSYQEGSYHYEPFRYDSPPNQRRSSAPAESQDRSLSEGANPSPAVSAFSEYPATQETAPLPAQPD